MEAVPTELRDCAAPRAEKGAPASLTVLAFGDRSAGEPPSAANTNKISQTYKLPQARRGAAQNGLAEFFQPVSTLRKMEGGKKRNRGGNANFLSLLFGERCTLHFLFGGRCTLS